MPPSRYGDHNGNMDLLHGAPYPSCHNEFLEYHQELIRKHKDARRKREQNGYQHPEVPPVFHPDILTKDVH